MVENLNYGIVLSGAGTSLNIVQGNFIGLNAGGQTALANSFAGIAVWNGATSNLIGGTMVTEGK